MGMNNTIRTRTEYAAINIATNMIGYFLNMAAGFVCRIVFVHTLSAEYLGVSGLFASVISVLSLADLGLPSAIIYALYKPIAENDQKKIAALMQFYRKAYMVIGLVVAAIGIGVIPFLKRMINMPLGIHENLYLIYALFLLGTVLSYFFSYRASLLIAMQRQYIVSGYSYVVTILQSIFQIVILLLTHAYLFYLILQIIGGIAYNIWISRKALRDYPYIADAAEPLSGQERKRLFVNTKALAFSRISGVLVNSTDSIAISFLRGVVSVGVAANYDLLCATLDRLLVLIFNALPGSIGNLNATSSREESYRVFRVLNLLNFWLYGWIGIGLALVSTDVVRVFFGNQYVLPFHIPFMMAVNVFSIGMLNASYTYKSTMGLFRHGQYLLFLTGAINLTLDVLFGHIWGIFGVYLATFVARGCTSLWYEPYAVFRYGLHVPPRKYWIRLVGFLPPMAAAGLFSYALCRLCSLQGILNVLCKIGICSVVTNAVFYLAFKRTEEYRFIKEHIGVLLQKNRILRKR